MPACPIRKSTLGVLVVLLAVGGGALLISRSDRGERPVVSAEDLKNFERQVMTEALDIETKEGAIAAAVFSPELLAQRCGQLFDSFWDALNLASNRIEFAAAFPTCDMVLPEWAETQSLGRGITFRPAAFGGRRVSPAEWRKLLGRLQSAGWQLAETEFRHNRFVTDDSGRPKRSEIYFAAHLARNGVEERALLEGDLTVEWEPDGTDGAPARLGLIDASRVSAKTRSGQAPFRPVLVDRVAPPQGSYFIDPLILHDLDGDGRSEIVLASANRVYKQQSDGQFTTTPLCRHSPGLLFTAMIADFDGDGAPDLLGARFEGLILFKGSPRGTFDEPPRTVWLANPRLKYGQAFTCGDIDGDGDLDVWLGQYKAPYLRGQMPTPYYDANDGHPSFLLLNDGRGNFSDNTVGAGLGSKRLRRVYTGSLVDLDSDGDLDLLTVSDFAGLDVYRNDSRGRFTDLTESWVDEPRAFGMAHTLSDFNADGRLDVLMTGMNSPTADRLSSLGLNRPGPAGDAAMRGRMTFGNRLYLGSGDGHFRQGVASSSIARSGWSWGCAAFDADNDGFPDVYIANGHESKQSVRDYETEFWLHDIHVADSREHPVFDAYFGGGFSRTRGRGHSYGGYERNRLYLNQAGGGFVEVAHLMGIGLQQDSRNVVADDLDGDGRMDLVVTTFEVWPAVQQTVRVFRNNLPSTGNWIGFRFRESTAGGSPIGVSVKLKTVRGVAIRQLVTGDSFRSQHANAVHFGLGDAGEVETVEIRWISGRTVTLRRPAINRWHQVDNPDAKRE